MKYRGHTITIRNATYSNRGRYRGGAYAKVCGPTTCCTCTPIHGGRFAVLLYACRIIRNATQAARVAP